MEYAFVAAITIILSFFIVSFIDSKRKIPLNRVMYRQSDNHEFLKKFFSRQTDQLEKTTQSQIRQKKNTTKLLVTEEDKAYWVVDNIFYTANVINGIPDFDNAVPIDTSDMSQNELDKMLFILDNLDRGDKNERGGSGD